MKAQMTYEELCESYTRLQTENQDLKETLSCLEKAYDDLEEDYFDLRKLINR